MSDTSSPYKNSSIRKKKTIFNENTSSPPLQDYENFLEKPRSEIMEIEPTKKSKISKIENEDEFILKEESKVNPESKIEFTHPMNTELEPLTTNKSQEQLLNKVEKTRITTFEGRREGRGGAISIETKPRDETNMDQYEDVCFSFNDEVNGLNDFSQLNWKGFNYGDFMSFLKIKKMNVKDYLGFYKNNHENGGFLSSHKNEDKILETFNIDSHHGAIQNITISYDRTKIFSAGYDQTIQIWDSINFDHIGTLSGHEGTITALYGCNDSIRLVSAGQDCTIRIWNTESYTEEKILRNTHNDDITKILLNVQEDRLFTASKDSTIQIYDIFADKLLCVLNYHNKSVNDMILTDDEVHFISCSHDHSIKILENYISRINLNKSPATLIGHTAAVIKIELFEYRDRKKIVSLGEDNNIIIWDLLTKRRENTISHNINQIFLMKLVPEKPILITINKKNTFQVWNLITSKEIIKKEMPNEKSNFTCLNVFIPLQPIPSFPIQIITGSEERYLKTFNMKSIDQFNIIFKSQSQIDSLTLTKDNKYIIFTTDLEIHIFDRSTERIERTLNNHRDLIHVLLLTPDSKTLISGSKDATIRIWDIESGLDQEQTLKTHEKEIISLIISADGEVLVSSSEDNSVKIWNFKKMEEIFSIKNLGKINKLCFGDDRKSELFLGGNDGVVKNWNFRRNLQINTFIAHSFGINGLVYSNKNRLLLSSSAEKNLKFWDVDNVEVIRIFTSVEEINGISLSSDELNVFLYDKSNSFRVVALATGIQESYFPINNFTKITNYIASYDNKDVIYSLDDGSLNIWSYQSLDSNNIFYIDNLLNTIDDDNVLIEMCGKQLWSVVFEEFIYPVKCTLLHYYAYNNEVKKIKRIFNILLLLNHKKFILNLNLTNKTWLDIIFKQKNMNLICFLLKILIKYPPNVGCWPNIERIIHEAAKMNYPSLHKLLYSRLFPLRLLSLNANENIFVEKANDLNLSYTFMIESKKFEGTRMNTNVSSLIRLPEMLYFEKMADRCKNSDLRNYAKIDVLDVPDLFRHKSNICSALMQTVMKQDDVDIYNSNAVKYFIEFKWNSYASGLFYRRFLMYVFLTLMITVYSVWLLPIRLRTIKYMSDLPNHEYGFVNFIFNCILGLVSVFLFFREVYKLLCYGIVDYFFNLRNFYFAINVALFIAMLIFDFLGYYEKYFDEDVIRCLHAFDLYMWILGVFFFARGFKNGFLINTIIKTLVNIKLFVVAFVLLIYNFGWASFILDKSWTLRRNFNDDKTNVMWKDQFMTFDYIYRIAIRDYSKYNEDTDPVIGLVLWFFFLVSTFLIIIVLTNMLIAYMLNIYQMMKEKRDLYYYQELMIIIDEIDKRAIFKKKQNKYLIVSNIYEEPKEERERVADKNLQDPADKYRTSEEKVSHLNMSGTVLAPSGNSKVLIKSSRGSKTKLFD